ncbi:hypothetical protein KQX54_018177 [Cotesia glomerata]|uniref:BTB domain-containing protein n=1 Tax=Cotesia glomerata TaxID=32391 RepID=A0AAV7IZR8_COTGL|nr:hypothetical protein KQX54_018177 [Cotesia glomerata]
MSLEENKSTGYVKFVWSPRFSPFPETIYSDYFKIDNLENVIFNIGLKFEPGLINFLTLWVKKSSSEVSSALIKVMFGNIEAKVETNDWKDLCFVPKNLAIPGTVKTRKPYDQKFYNSEELSDVTIIVDKFEIPAHKVILAAQSEVFAKMLQSGMKEAMKNEINIKGLDLEIILEMLHYCYKGETKASEDTKVALQMLEVADIYQIIKLNDICERTLINNMSTENVLDIIDAADDHNAFDLRKSAINLIVLHSKKVVASKKFQKLCYKKPELMFELTYAFGNK